MLHILSFSLLRLHIPLCQSCVNQRKYTHFFPFHYFYQPLLLGFLWRLSRWDQVLLLYRRRIEECRWNCQWWFRFKYPWCQNWEANRSSSEVPGTWFAYFPVFSISFFYKKNILSYFTYIVRRIYFWYWVSCTRLLQLYSSRWMNILLLMYSVLLSSYCFFFV